MLELNKCYNMDCMMGMKEFPDGYFDLAVVDPPYGGAGNELKRTVTRTGGTWAAKYGKHINDWDVAPGEEYFKELFRVSKNQIIWGGNYFDLPPCRCFIVWRKSNIPEGFTMSMCEYAWTSFNNNAKLFELPSSGKGRFHPTQKPVALYDRIFANFAKPGDKIVDTHLGSGSSRISAYNAGLDFIGFEIDEEYFAKEEERFQAHASQISLFDREN